MAKYGIAYLKTKRYEGGYANNFADKGKETYAGVTRINFPNTPIWKYVDAAKIKARYNVSQFLTKTTRLQIDEYVKDNPEIQILVRDFYEVNFWKAIKGDLINDQSVANSVYDFAVNTGVGRAIRFLQTAAGVKDDGVFGPATLASVNGANGHNLHKRYNEARRAYYISIAKGDQAQFLSSWLGRLEAYV